MDSNNTEQNQHESGRGDPFSRMMFGDNRRSMGKNQQTEKPGFIEQFEVDALLQHVDAFMTAANELRPLFRKARPLLDQFLPKK
ncbi:hypothetical protein [Bacillus massilinigeriensis]|uniref:hypothetical protein n=1 Tax=Bacillus mediterraneensis TaxID=1805474 RepID=UPI0008F870B1|nr:hypothetical protein [Bacillus mediterraneensis]